MWRHMAQRVADHPGVVGLELLNEPGWGTAPNIDAWKATTLTPFHTDTIAWLRGKIGDGPLILFNNTGIEAVGLSPVKHIHPAGEGIIYAPHLYDAGLISGKPYAGNVPEEHIAPLAEYSRQNGLHPLIGEFGYHLDATGGEAWLTDMVASLDKHRVSGTLWEYSQNPELWNLEDLSLVDPAGSERPIVDVYVRPYLRALAGHDSTFTWDPTTRSATTQWTGDGGISELSLPPRLFPTPPDLTLAGPGACYTLDLERGELLVQAPAGTIVELTFTAP
jgi:endoglycosylceramidase